MAWELCCSLYLYLMRVSASGGYVGMCVLGCGCCCRWRWSKDEVMGIVGAVEEEEEVVERERGVVEEARWCC